LLLAQRMGGWRTGSSLPRNLAAVG
jgi:hypothetical protein